MEAITVTLDHPIKRPDGELTALRLREPTMADLKRMDRVRGDVGKACELTLAVCLDGLTPKELDEHLSPRDFGKVQDALLPFLPGDHEM